jgi:DNA-binding winged helix-turn-helix (wHTH) protein
VQFRFDDFALDVGRRELWRGSTLVPIEPQVFDLLLFLIRHRDRVVGKDDLIDGVWGGRIVSDSTLTSRINAARKAVGDNGEAQRLIRTAARKGIRFVGEVREDAAAAPQSGSRPTTTSASDAQEVTFCRTHDGISLAIAAVGRGEPLVKAANWLTHVEYDWESPVWSSFLHRLAERQSPDPIRRTRHRVVGS